MNKEKFYNLLKPLVSIYDDIEKDMILDILERIDNYDGQKGTLKWYLDKLNELKVFEKYGVSIVNKKKKEIKKILNQILEFSTKKSVDLDILEKYNNHNNTTLTVNDIYDSTSANNLINEALKDTINISKLINTKAIEAAKTEYQNILNTAYLETSTGIYTYDKSIKLAIDKMAQNGILMTNYDSGRRISIESAVRRDIVTRVNKLVGDIELTTAKDIMKTNLVYVDQHLGARTRTKYTKEDYEAHDEWQGKIYMIDGSNDKYDNLYEKTGYGKMLGLKGINCYHDLRPYFEWESIPKPINIEESRKERELLNTQREYERKIRTLKREKIVNKKMGYEKDYKKVSNKLTEINKRYDKWLNDNERLRNLNKEYVSKNIDISKNDQYKEKINKMIVGQLEISKYTNEFQITTNDVILTPERRQHILDKHSEVSNYLNKLDDILNNPDAIYQQTKKEDTIWIVKRFEKNVKLTIKLNTANNIKEKGFKNSIINMQFIRDSELKRVVKNGSIRVLFDNLMKK